MNVNGNFLKRAFAAAVLMLAPCLAQAAYNSGSTGADGAFSPTATSAIQIPESGIFNFTTVNIPTGVTISFIKNSRNTPVTILASGDVTIAGTVKVDGSNASIQIPGDGGPGGFAGGMAGAAGKNGLRGEGPGGGGGGTFGGGTSYGAGGGGAGYGLDGTAGSNMNTSIGGVKGTLYGNEQILPLMGGSGGGGGSGSGGVPSSGGGGGGGGGGALLIASSGTINILGTITAKGGNGTTGEVYGTYYYAGGGGAGSGGSIRLICETLAGNGSITAITGSYGSSTYGGYGGAGTLGRIRLEFNNKTRTAVTSPTYTYGAPAPAVPSTIATLTIQSVGGADVPATSQGLMNAPDVNLPWGTANPINIVVRGANIPVGTTITIKASPSVGPAVTASGTLAGTAADSNVTIPISIATAYPSVITATCTYTVIASNGGPIYAGGERVEKVRVASVVGGGSSITYITESGRGIPVIM